ncbi:MAG TPA: hypothetical protein DCS28_03655 [Candidatus Moranbacteria bacterium]|nr:hypothetical protein [Candidatus Moranbacteria bacterium]
MKIAIISDIHNNEVNLEKVLDYCGENKIEKIICCGDLASKETLDFLNDTFSGEIHYCFGNMDNEQLHDISAKGGPASGWDFNKNYRNTFIFKDFGEVKIDDRKIAFVHFPREAKKLAETGKYDFVFYGHTHKPWTEKIGNCIMLNPGNVTGDFYPPTFATWDTENNKFELIRIHELK